MCEDCKNQEGAELKNSALTIGVAIDAWKLKIFKKHLDTAGYAYTENKGVTPDTLLLKVVTSNINELGIIITRASEECAKWKRNQKLN